MKSAAQERVEEAWQSLGRVERDSEPDMRSSASGKPHREAEIMQADVRAVLLSCSRLELQHVRDLRTTERTNQAT